MRVTLADVLLGTAQSLRAHALRFGLTSLGIVWGLFMLTLLVAEMDGFNDHWERATTKIGARLLFLIPGTVSKESSGDRDARSVEFRLEDVERLNRLEILDAAAPSKDMGHMILRAGPRTKLVPTYGVTEKTAEIRNFSAVEGRVIHASDVAQRSLVVFLGAEASERLFGQASAVGKTVHIAGVPFRVIGVAERKGMQTVNFGASDDSRAQVPITTAQRWLSRDENVGMIVAAVRNPSESWDAIKLVRLLLGRHHGFEPDHDNAMMSFNLEEVLGLIRVLGLGLTLFFTAASVITLLVGSVGVMNIMLVVVRERTREIGLRKAVGASNAAIFVQFLAETLAVTLISGALGALLGWGVVELQTAAVPAGADFVHVPILGAGTLVMLTLTMVSVGVAAGVLPAMRAARVDPAVALRAS